MFLLKSNTNADFAFLKKVLALDSDYSAVLNTGELALFLRQRLGTGKVDFNYTAFTDRSCNRYRKEYTALADVRAFSIEKPVGLRYPDTYRPTNVRAIFLSLFD